MYLSIPVLKGTLLMELFILARNLSSLFFCLLHSLCEDCFGAGTSSCFVQKNVENNQNYCKIDVLKPNIGVRDKGNKSYY